MACPVVSLGRIWLGVGDQSSGSREEMKMWPDGWEWALSALLEGSGSSEFLSLELYPWSFSPSYHFFAKISIFVFKDGLTYQTFYDLKSLSVWLLLLNGPKCFFVLGGANLAIHREAVSL